MWRLPRCRCVGPHGLVSGIARRGSVLLSRGWLITVEAPGHPRHPPSTQLDAFVDISLLLLLVYSLRKENFFSVGYVKFMCLNYWGMKPFRHCLKSKQHHYCPTNALIHATLSLNVDTTIAISFMCFHCLVLKNWKTMLSILDLKALVTAVWWVNNNNNNYYCYYFSIYKTCIIIVIILIYLIYCQFEFPVQWG